MSNSKLVLVVTSTFPFGQGEEFFEAEIRGLIASGMKIILVPLWPRGSLRQGVSDLNYITLKRTKVRLGVFLSSFFHLTWSEIRTTRKIRLPLIQRYLKESLAASYGPQLAKIVSELQVSLIHAYWASGPAMLAMYTSRLSTVGWTFSGHSGDLIDSVDLAKKVKSSDGIRCISERGYQVLKQAADVDVSPVIIHLGVEVPLTGVTQSQTSNFKIACVGNLIPIKNHKTLFDAIRLIKNSGINFSVDIIGSGPLEIELKRYVEVLNLEKFIFFRGQMVHSKLMEEYSREHYQLIVLASGVADSGQQEGIPVTLMEAMSYGIPVVSTETGAIPELITRELDLLVPSGDSNALSKKIFQILSMPPAERNALAFKCRSRILEDFNVVRTSRALEKWLNSFMN